MVGFIILLDSQVDFMLLAIVSINVEWKSIVFLCDIDILIFLR